MAMAWAGGPFHPSVPGAMAEAFALEAVDLAADTIPAPENKRLVAIGLCALLGPFGAHRLYLGTTAKVPIVYGLTFGGFGVLVLIDLAHLLLQRDLAPFQGNNRVLMWSAPASTPP
jgi:TM2 domain-containing membrane protein YozV